MESETIKGKYFILIYGIITCFIFLRSNIARADDVQPSAEVFLKYVNLSDSKNLSCRDTTICTSDSADSSTSHQMKIIHSSDNSRGVESASEQTKYTKSRADSYGITDESQSGFIDKDTYKGSESINFNGPKGHSYTYTVPPSGWVVEEPGQWSQTIKGNDTSSFWDDYYGKSPNGTDATNGIWETYSYSADSSEALVIKGNPAREYNITLVAQAAEWHLNKASDFNNVVEGFNPEYVIQGNDVPCSSVSIMGKNLDSNCERTFKLTPGVYDITPKAGIPRYTYQVNASGVVSDAGPAPTPVISPIPTTSKATQSNNSTVFSATVVPTVAPNIVNTPTPLPVPSQQITSPIVTPKPSVSPTPQTSDVFDAVASWWSGLF